MDFSSNTALNDALHNLKISPTEEKAWKGYADLLDNQGYKAMADMLRQHVALAFNAEKITQEDFLALHNAMHDLWPQQASHLTQNVLDTLWQQSKVLKNLEAALEENPIFEGERPRLAIYCSGGAPALAYIAPINPGMQVQLQSITNAFWPDNREYPRSRWRFEQGKVDAEQPEQQGYSRKRGLHEAIAYNQLGLMHLLIDYGANVNPQPGLYPTPLEKAAMHNSCDAAELLLQSGADITKGCPLFDAYKYGKSPEMLQFLIQKIKDSGGTVDQPDHKTNKGWTPFFLAAFQNDLSSAELFLQHGASVDAADALGNTALHQKMLSAYQINEESETTIRFLLEKGANVFALNKEGKTPIELALAAYNLSETLRLDIAQHAVRQSRNAHDRRFIMDKVFEHCPQFFLEIAGSMPDTDARLSSGTWQYHLSRLPFEEFQQIATWIKSHGGDLSEKSSGWSQATLLHYTACAEQHATEKTRFLLENGADIHATDMNGETALFETKSKETCELLIQHGATVNVKDKRGNPLLFKARNAAVAGCLIDNGADIHVTDAKQQTLLHVTNSPELVNLLLERKADPNHPDKDGNTALHTCVTYRKDPHILWALLNDPRTDTSLKNKDPFGGEGKTAQQVAESSSVYAPYAAILAAHALGSTINAGGPRRKKSAPAPSGHMSDVTLAGNRKPDTLEPGAGT